MLSINVLFLTYLYLFLSGFYFSLYFPSFGRIIFPIFHFFLFSPPTLYIFQRLVGKTPQAAPLVHVCVLVVYA